MNMVYRFEVTINNCLDLLPLPKLNTFLVHIVDVLRSDVILLDDFGQLLKEITDNIRI